jgi:hypothetical protein
MTLPKRCKTPCLQSCTKWGRPRRWWCLPPISQPGWSYQPHTPATRPMRGNRPRAPPRAPHGAGLPGNAPSRRIPGARRRGRFRPREARLRREPQTQIAEAARGERSRALRPGWQTRPNIQFGLRVSRVLFNLKTGWQESLTILEMISPS